MSADIPWLLDTAIQAVSAGAEIARNYFGQELRYWRKAHSFDSVMYLAIIEA